MSPNMGPDVAQGKNAPWPLPFWIAHRGAGKLAPENTLAAFRVGAAAGYQAFECDVKLSADGVPFLLHDTELLRTTGAPGIAGDLRWTELSRLDAGSWHSQAYAGEPLPSFEAIARYCLANGFALDLEIKPTPGRELETGRVVAREATRLWKGHRSSANPSGSDTQPPPPLLLSSFRPESLQGAAETAPELPRALLLNTLWEGWFAIATQLACVACIARHDLMDATLIGQLHTAGMRALVYTVNDAAETRRLIDLGIDGIVTDAVDQLGP